MVAIRVSGAVGQGLGALATGVDHLEVVDTGAGPVVVGLSSVGGGLVTLSFGGNGQAVVADTQSLNSAFWDQSIGNLSLINTGDSVFAAVAREGSHRLLGYEIEGASIGAAGTLQGNGLSAGSSALYQVSSTGHLFAASMDGTLRSFAQSGAQSFVAGQTVHDTDDMFLATPGAVETLSVGAREFVVMASTQETGVSVFEVAPGSGDLSHTGSIGTDTGLGLFPTVVDMETVAVGGQGFVLLVTRAETSESAALTVLALDGTGQPQVTDHILDNQLSRFGMATELEVVHHDGWTYVLASGGDDGVSLFALNPAGRLVHLDTVFSTGGAMLDSVSGMAAAIAQDGNLQVLLAQHTAIGFAQLEVDLSAQGDVITGAGQVVGTTLDDMLIGSHQADTLSGGTGNDILQDGGGEDRLRGGAGADSFVMVADGARDRIDDFEAGVDRVDLSAVSFLYSMDQIQYSSRNWGAQITYRGEVLELRSADGGSLTEWQVAAAIDWTIDRPLLAFFEPDPNSSGTEGSDTLIGGEGADTLYGYGGDDSLVGALGDDLIDGGEGNDTLFAGQGQDTVQGGAGRDWIALGDGNDLFTDSAETGSDQGDTVFGGAGDDTLTSFTGGDALYGEAGNDVLTGGTGADAIFGGSNYDTVYAGAGNDTVWGGDGRDLIFLGEGADLFFDNAQGDEFGRDTVFAGIGNDTIEGGNGDDVFHGEDDNDVINARLGNDEVFGGAGFDTISAGDGADTVYGGDGRDLVFLNQGNDLFTDNAQDNAFGSDTVFGGFGDDTIVGGGGDDAFHGEWGNDLMSGDLGNDSVYGGDGDDRIYAGAGDDMAWGGNGRDLVYLGTGNDLFFDTAEGGVVGRDTVFAGEGNDTIEGGNGDDVFHGEWGNDVINARLGNDTVYGGDGFDTVFAGEGADVIFGGNGRDLVYLDLGNDLFVDNDQSGDFGRDTVYAGEGDDTIEGGHGDDLFFGEGGSDVIGAGLGNDSIYAGVFDDTVFAGADNDLVFGGMGRDQIWLGAGNDRFVDTDQDGAFGRDTITGGAGADVFVFGTTPSQDVITDFELGVDQLALAVGLAGGRSAAQVAGDAVITGNGVMLNFDAGQSIFLEGLGTTVGLADDIQFF